MFLSISFGFGRSHIYQLSVWCFGVKMFFLNGRFFFKHVCIYTQIYIYPPHTCVRVYTHIQTYLYIQRSIKIQSQRTAKRKPRTSSWGTHRPDLHGASLNIYRARFHLPSSSLSASVISASLGLDGCRLCHWGIFDEIQATASLLRDADESLERSLGSIFDLCTATL